MEGVSAIILLAGLGTLVGVALLWHGLRGRRVDDHPVCRRCGFDLFGLPAGGTICSECGANLMRERAVKVGNRQRRRWATSAGLCMLLTFGLVTVALGYSAARGINLNQYKPVWMLLHELQANRPGAVDEVFAELQHRCRNKNLSQAQAISLADTLRLLANVPQRRWETRLGNLMEQLHDANGISDESWFDYCRAAAPVRIEIPPRIKRGEPIPVGVRLVDAWPQSPQTTHLLRFWIKTLDIGGQHTEIGSRSVCVNFEAAGPAGGMGGDSAVTLTSAQWEAIPDGPSQLTFTVHSSMGTRLSPYGSYNSKSIYWAADFQVTAATLILPSAQRENVTAELSTELRKRIRSSFRLKSLGTSEFEISATDLPADISAGIYLRRSKLQWRLASLTAGKGSNLKQNISTTSVLYRGATGEIVLKPDYDLPQAAKFREIWPEEIVLKCANPN